MNAWRGLLARTTRASLPSSFWLVFALNAAACEKSGAATSAPTQDTPRPTLEELAAQSDQHVRRIGDQPLIVRADPTLEPELEHLWNLLWQMQADGARLYDGQILALGWTTVWFREQRGPEGGVYFVAEAPDYQDQNGLRRSDDLSDTLRVLATQRPWLTLTGVSAEELDFDQHVLVARGSLDSAQVYLVRVASPGGRLTGWRLAAVDVVAGEMEVDSIPVHELWRRRPSLLQTMLLPSGWMSYFDGDEVVAIVDPGDQLIWQRDAPAPIERSDQELGDDERDD